MKGKRPEKIKIALILDDEPDIREIVEETLLAIGHFCIKAPDIYTAIQIFNCNDIDLALIDISLPSTERGAENFGNGLDFLVYLKRHGYIGKSICISGFADMLGNDPILKQFDHIVSKPFTEDDLLKALYTTNSDTTNLNNAPSNTNTRKLRLLTTEDESAPPSLSTLPTSFQSSALFPVSSSSLSSHNRKTAKKSK